MAGASPTSSFAWGDATRVDTANTQVALTRPGLYRIEVTPDRQQTTITVRDGEALVGLANHVQQVLPAQTASVYGLDPADADIRYSVGMDGFDTWSADRDRRYKSSSSTAYVSRAGATGQCAGAGQHTPGLARR